MEKNAKDYTFIVVTNQSSSQKEYEGATDSSETSSIKNEEKLKIMALEAKIQRLKDKLIFAREELEKSKTSAQVSTSK